MGPRICLKTGPLSGMEPPNFLKKYWGLKLALAEIREEEVVGGSTPQPPTTLVV